MVFILPVDKSYVISYNDNIDINVIWEGNMTDLEIMELYGRDNLQKLTSTIKKAYSYADLLVEDNELFQTPSRYNVIQELYNLAIDYSLMKDCDNKLLPFAYKFSLNKRKNCTHIELTNGCGILTHSSVQTPLGFPRNAIFRNELANSSQTILSGFDDSRTSTRYGIITHNKGSNGIVSVGLTIPDCTPNNWMNNISLTELIQPLEVFTNVNYEEYTDFKLALKEINNNTIRISNI